MTECTEHSAVTRGDQAAAILFRLATEVFDAGRTLMSNPNNDVPRGHFTAWYEIRRLGAVFSGQRSLRILPTARAESLVLHMRRAHILSHAPRDLEFREPEHCQCHAAGLIRDLAALIESENPTVTGGAHA